MHHKTKITCTWIFVKSFVMYWYWDNEDISHSFLSFIYIYYLLMEVVVFSLTYILVVMPIPYHLAWKCHSNMWTVLENCAFYNAQNHLYSYGHMHSTKHALISEKNVSDVCHYFHLKKPRSIKGLIECLSWGWFKARLVTKDGHQEDTRHKDIGLCAQIIAIILYLIDTGNKKVFVSFSWFYRFNMILFIGRKQFYIHISLLDKGRVLLDTYLLWCLILMNACSKWTIIAIWS